MLPKPTWKSRGAARCACRPDAPLDFEVGLSVASKRRYQFAIFEHFLAVFLAIFGIAWHFMVSLGIAWHCMGLRYLASRPTWVLACLGPNPRDRDGTWTQNCGSSSFWFISRQPMKLIDGSKTSFCIVSLQKLPSMPSRAKISIVSWSVAKADSTALRRCLWQNKLRQVYFRHRLRYNMIWYHVISYTISYISSNYIVYRVMISYICIISYMKAT